MFRAFRKPHVGGLANVGHAFGYRDPIAIDLRTRLRVCSFADYRSRVLARMSDGWQEADTGHCFMGQTVKFAT